MLYILGFGVAKDWDTTLRPAALDYVEKVENQWSPHQLPADPPAAICINASAA